MRSTCCLTIPMYVTPLPRQHVTSPARATHALMHIQHATFARGVQFYPTNLSFMRAKVQPHYVWKPFKLVVRIGPWLVRIVARCMQSRMHTSMDITICICICKILRCVRANSGPFREGTLGRLLLVCRRQRCEESCLCAARGRGFWGELPSAALCAGGSLL